MQLWNRVDKRILEKNLLESNENRVTISFYKYVRIDDPTAWRDELYLAWDKLNVLGRIYVAHEGINAQLSVPGNNIPAFTDYLYSYPFLNGIRLNYAVDDDGKSFTKLKILVRNKIVADGLHDETFDSSNSGIHLNAKEFNELTDQKDTIIVDMRNHYESEIGHFEKAITPDVDTFRDQLPLVVDMLQEEKNKPVVMYCTGGIRCEKASAWLKHNGFKNVYQLSGGIIEYARQVQEQGLKNKFRGKNFVFDRRLGEKISREIIAQCHQCGAPADTHTNCKNEACHLLFIQCEQCAQKYKGCCCEDCMSIAALPEEEQKELRKGIDPGRKVFKKGRGDQLTFKKHASNIRSSEIK
ncbi:MAG: rhodanese-related sulfurtransferase [Bacteroidota bacterium]|nr:rhodanese-related sulfurtransferase [Bacteroidota bacterium]